MARTAALAAFGLVAGTAFVASPGSSGARSLRAQPQVQSTSAAPTSGLFTACSVASVLAATSLVVTRRVARRAAAPSGPSGQELAKTIPRPEELLQSPKFPKFLGASGGYMSRSTVERHAITWTSDKEHIFYMPTGLDAQMNIGENLCYFRRKEQCIAVCNQLRKLKINDVKIYRLNADGTVVFMHPADGVFPEKVNKGRVQVNGRPFTCAQNPTQFMVAGTKYEERPYEADPLTVMFLKSRTVAFSDFENVFAQPFPDPENPQNIMGVDPAEFPDQAEYMKSLMGVLNDAQRQQKELQASI